MVLVIVNVSAFVSILLMFDVAAAGFLFVCLLVCLFVFCFCFFPPSSSAVIRSLR